MSELIRRAITGAFLVLGILILLYLGKTTAYLLLLSIGIIGAIEFYTIVSSKQAYVRKWEGVILILSLFFTFLLYKENYFPFEGLSIVFVPVLYIMIAELYRFTPNSINGLGLTFMGVLYISLSICSALFLMYTPVFEYELLMSIFIMLWIADSGAYVFGTLFGKHKLFPSISPNKSWEGFIGGNVFALAAAYCIGTWVFPEIEMLLLLITGLVVVLMGTFGDLFESMIKRSYGVKDSGSILPGHGGILDRFDGLLLILPVEFVVYNIYTLF